MLVECKLSRSGVRFWHRLGRWRPLRLPPYQRSTQYWRHPNKGPLAGRHLISEDGRSYRAAVHGDVLQQLRREPKIEGRIAVAISANPPDRRQRDLDNLLKGVLDAMTHAHVWIDDSQIDDLRIVRDEVMPGGRLIVTVREVEGA